jgi:predicted RNA methylase
VSGFSASWLALREPADRAARDVGLIDRLAAALNHRNGLSIVDLGTGSGSNMRALAPLLPGPQSWLLVDNDPALLEQAQDSARTLTDRDGRTLVARTVLANLAQPGWGDVLTGADLITMSALLDLVSEDFIATLARAAKGAAIHATLTVDGRMACLPVDPLDQAVFAAFCYHMDGDKGFGPSLGARAGEMAARRFEAEGFRVEHAPADWQIGPDQPGLLMALLEGWIEAVRETGHVSEADLTRWAKRRRAEAKAGSLELRVGHVDLLALPL